MAIITTENVCRVFGTGKESVQALKNVSIEVQEGTLTMLKGAPAPEKRP